MANSIINSNQRSVLHIDTTDGAKTLAELKGANEDTPTKAHIVDIYWQTAGSLTIDRGGTAVHAFTGTGHWNLMQSGCLIRWNSNSRHWTYSLRRHLCNHCCA